MSAMLVVTLPKNKIVKRNSGYYRSHNSILDVLKIGSLWYGITILASAQLTLTMLLTLTESHFRPLQLTAPMVGLGFSMLGLTYAGATLFLGFLCHKGIHPILMMSTGMVWMAVGLSVLGPLPLFNKEPTFTLLLIGFSIVGVGYGAVLMPSRLFIKKVSKAIVE